MAQTILLFRINRDKYAVIQNVCRTLGIRIIDVARKDYSQKLGTLAQIQGFTREAKKYDGPEFPAEMLIFSEKPFCWGEVSACWDRLFYRLQPGYSDLRQRMPLFGAVYFLFFFR